MNRRHLFRKLFGNAVLLSAEFFEQRFDLSLDEILLLAAHAQPVQQGLLHRQRLLLVTVELFQKFIHPLGIVSTDCSSVST